MLRRFPSLIRTSDVECAKNPSVDFKASSITAAVLCTTLALGVLLRQRKTSAHFYYALFAATLGSWYFTAFIQIITIDVGWERANLVVGVFVPLTAMLFLRAYSSPTRAERRGTTSFALASATALTAAIAAGFERHPIVRVSLFVHVTTFVVISLLLLYKHARRQESKRERARALNIAVFGTVAGLITMLEYLPYLGLELPRFGTALTLLFLYALSQGVIQQRMLDLYEISNRLVVVSILSLILSAVLWGLVKLAGDDSYYMPAFFAAMGLFLVFEPVRDWLRRRTSPLFFGERHAFQDMLTALSDAKSRVNLSPPASPKPRSKVWLNHEESRTPAYTSQTPPVLRTFWTTRQVHRPSTVST